MGAMTMRFLSGTMPPSTRESKRSAIDLSSVGWIDGLWVGGGEPHLHAVRSVVGHEDHQATAGPAGRARAGCPLRALESGHPRRVARWPTPHLRAGGAHRRHLAEGADRAAARARGPWPGEPAT